MSSSSSGSSCSNWSNFALFGFTSSASAILIQSVDTCDQSAIMALNGLIRLASASARRQLAIATRRIVAKSSYDQSLFSRALLSQHVSTQRPMSTNEAAGQQTLGRTEPTYMIQFKCNKCGTTQTKHFSKHAYHHGI
eukprot:TRINITY_DN11946_c0_g1_i2.p4 TRINITY_DN11946_c0_g1~~TRINITY_DN11946_c0_g1_i2.p4  ORF type:complete len:137 (-),score=6.26 TRINITY_DN11946_c0_g1_i2:1249-1659(-)